MNDGARSHVERVQRLALQEFQKALRANLASAWKPEHGQPPGCGYVEQKAFSQEPWLASAGLHAWYITPNEAVALTGPNRPSTQGKIDGMFYNLLIGHFGISNDLAQVAVHWQTGPRFGRGFLYAVQQDANGVMWLGRGQPLWVS